MANSECVNVNCLLSYMWFLLCYYIYIGLYIYSGDTRLGAGRCRWCSHVLLCMTFHTLHPWKDVFECFFFLLVEPQYILCNIPTGIPTGLTGAHCSQSDIPCKLLILNCGFFHTSFFC